MSRPAATRWGSGAAGRRRPSPVTLTCAALAVVGLVLPFYVEEFWLRTGFAVFGAIVGAVGLNILTGTAGQLSLGHAFFLAVGAVSYCFLSGESSSRGATEISGLGLPPLVGMVLAVGISGVAGVVFSPVAARLRGLYLGIASLGLVVVGQHVLNTATPLTGGFNGRTAPDFSLFGFSFTDSDPELSVLGVPFGQAERLWYLGLVLAALSMIFARNLLRGRPGLAMQMIRDSTIAASVNGVNVPAYRARAFLVSSMYAGLSGVLYALSIGSVAPESFALEVSVQYLVMIVLGGLGSVGGAAVGAAFVTALPLTLQQYSDSLPLLSEPGSGGVSYAEVARYLYGAAVIIIVLLEPAGLAGLAKRLRRRGSTRATTGAAVSPASSGDPPGAGPPAGGQSPVIPAPSGAAKA